MQNFSHLLQRLADAGLEFVLVGGFAAVAHGSFHLTRDVDICALLTSDNIGKLREALAGWNPKHRMTPQKLSFLLHPTPGETVNNLYLQTDLGMVDILTSIKGVETSSACGPMRRSSRSMVGGFTSFPWPT